MSHVLWLLIESNLGVGRFVLDGLGMMRSRLRWGLHVCCAVIGVQASGATVAECDSLAMNVMHWCGRYLD